MGKLGPDGKLSDLTIQEKQRGPNRVDPKAIRSFDGGDIFYYTKGELLQLIIYAPDGTFVEWVDELPSANYRSSLMLRPNQPKDNLYAAQVLFYVESLAAQHYNLVQFMGDATTVPGAAVASLPGSKKIELAGRIGIFVLNPVTRKPETAATKCSPGVILEGTPLKICTVGGPSLALTEMTPWRARTRRSARPAKKPKPTAKPKPGERPPGGHTPGGSWWRAPQLAAADSRNTPHVRQRQPAPGQQDDRTARRAARDRRCPAASRTSSAKGASRT